ncbi:MAG: acetyl-CoA carboxylase biotin carboxyl carrier protein subunit [Desulfobacteraceae bacterium]
MKYHLDINGEKKTVELDSSSRSQARGMVCEKPVDLEFHRMSERKIHMRINGRQINAWVERTPEGKTIIVNGRFYFVFDRDAREQEGNFRPGKPGPGNALDIVTPPMPAVVIQVPVSKGDRVKKGDTVVVVSAMKMETSLKAPYSGRITRIGVTAGDKVMPGDILADIEKITEGETP